MKNFMKKIISFFSRLGQMKFFRFLNPINLLRLIYKNKSIFIFFIIFASYAVYILFWGIIHLLNDKAYVLNEVAKPTQISTNSVSSISDTYVYKGKVNSGSLYVYYPENVFHIDYDKKDITDKVSSQPEIRGKWSARGNNLYFIPEGDWLPNTKYVATVSPEVFSENFDIKDSARKIEFTTNLFSSKVSDSSFYEDPRDVKKKMVTASFRFNYPINFDNIKEKISIRSYSGDKYDFTVKQGDDYQNVIHIISDPVKVKKDEDYVEVKVAGVENIYNKIKTSTSTAKIKIPSSSTFFKINSVDTRIVSNEEKNNEAEQILFVNFSTFVEDKKLDEYVEFYTYPESCYYAKQKMKKSTMPADVDGMKKLETQRISKDLGKTHMFKYDVTKRDSCVITRIKQGLVSLDGFVMNADHLNYTTIANYPMEANLAFQGALMSLQGDKKVTLVSRGVDAIDVTVARIDSKDINHLVSQTYGDFDNPYFRNYNFDEENIAEIFRKTLKINAEHPAKRDYSSVDLNDYFQSKKGLFMISIKGKYGNGSYTYKDKRFVLITDMGIIVKKNLDKSNNVFISNFSNGTPVADAKVELLGKNGVPVLSSTTNGVGMASIPNYSDFSNEKSPTVIVVTKNNDISFIPVDRGNRELDLSQFDVGGLYNSGDEKNISGYMFSDRGIYRPGEKASFGIIVRDGNLAAPKKLAMKLIIDDARGNTLVDKKLWSDEYGFLEYSYNIKANAPVGTYYARLYDVSKDYSNYITDVAFSVEEFVPDNMKIKLKLEDVKSKGWYNKKNLNALVNLQNLYGKPATSHDISARLNLRPQSFSFREFSGYSFKDPLVIANQYRRTYSEDLETIKTDKDGNSRYEISLDQFDKGTYIMSVDATGYELEGGRSVFTSSSVLVSPLEYLVGYKGDGGSMYSITKNAERSVDFIAIDNELNKIAKDTLNLKVMTIEYVKNLVQMDNGTYKYQSIPVEKMVAEKKISIPKTGNKMVLDTSKSGSYYIVIEDKEGSILSRFDYSIQGAANTSFEVDKDANLTVTLDKKQCNNGDTIAMKIISPYEGYGLITIEKDKVVNYKWFKTSSTTTTEYIRLPYTIEGNAYINVSFIRGNNSREIFMPPLSYTVVPFEINKEKRTTKIDLNIPEVVKPGEDLVVKYKTSRPGKIVVYGVNEGILQVAKYKTPDPINAFIKKQALRVRTSQIMDLIMPDMRLLNLYKATGGDEDEMAAELEDQINPFARKQNEVVAFWSGIIDSTTEYQEYKYSVPAIFNGNIKVMAVFISEDTFGKTDKGVFARGDFAMIPSAPFNVTPGDEFIVGTSISNLIEGSGESYQIKVSVDADSGLEVIDGNEKIITLGENEETSLNFKVKALDKLGSNTLMFKAVSVSDDSKNFKIPHHVGIRPASPYLTKLTMGYEPSKLKLKDYPMPMYNEYRMQEVVASVSPLVLAEGLIKYLDKYPHGCSEQIISRIYPLIEVFFKYPHLVSETDVYKLYDEVVTKLAERQANDGGVAMWSYGYNYSNEYISLYAYDFLTMAKSRNFNVPQGMLNKLETYVKSVAGRDPRSVSDVAVSQAIYLLTRNGEVTTNYLVNAEKEYKAQSKKWRDNNLAATYLASSYHLLKNDDKARGALGKYKFGNDQVEDSKYIALMSQYFPEDIKSLDKEIVKALLEPLKKGRYTTSSSSNALFALLNYKYDKKKDKKIEFKDIDATYDAFARANVSSENKLIEVKLDEKGGFYYVLREQGFTRETLQKAKSNFVEVSKEFKNDKGETITKAKIGDEVTVVIKARTVKKDSVNNMAITDLFAGPFEFVLDSMNSSSSLDNFEGREDRALIYLSLNKNMSTISYKVKAIAKGKFVVPPVFAEALYDTDVKANGKGSIFVVEE